MIKFKLNAGELIDVLDPIHKDAYDRLQGALERKVLDVIAEKKWLEIWESGAWTIEASIKFNLPNELENED